MISILITHFNRYKALEQCLTAIKKVNWKVPFEIVVSDDGSNQGTQQQLKTLAIDTLLLSEINCGLASNLNKGIRACQGKYLLYVQEDFMIAPDFGEILKESLQLLNNGSLDMIRYTANYRFAKLFPTTSNINKIPNFSFQNFNLNAFQYSDNPFITTPAFFVKYGYFLENTSGGYGETEFAIRILKSKAKIGITNKYYFHHAHGIPSVMDSTLPSAKRISRRGFKKKIWRTARAIRQHFEWFMYNPNSRKLFTYTNKRK